MSVEIIEDVAASIRIIAAESDKVTGRILRKIEKTAKNGGSHIIVVVSERDKACLLHKERLDDKWDLGPVTLTPLIEKLFSLGFKLKSTERSSFWSFPQIDISW